MVSEMTTVRVVCSIKWCKNYTVNFSCHKLGTLFWRFPKDKNRCSEWVSKCQRKDLRDILEQFGSSQLNEHHFICSDHFSHSDYIDSKNFNRGLADYAVPSVNLDPIAPEPGEIVNKRKRCHQDNRITDSEKQSDNLSKANLFGSATSDKVNSSDTLDPASVPPKVVAVDTYFSNRYGKSGAKCVVYSCDNYICQQNAPSYYRLPKDSKRCLEWIKVLNRPEFLEKFKSLGPGYCNKTYRICSDHFKSENFRNPRMKSQGIFREAVPSLKLDEKNVNKQTESKMSNPSKPKNGDNKILLETNSGLSSPLPSDNLPEPSLNSDDENFELANIQKQEKNLSLNVEDEKLSHPHDIIQTQEKFPKVLIKEQYSSELHDILELSKTNKKLADKLRDLEVHANVMSKKIIKYQCQLSALRSRNAALRTENRSLKRALKPQAPIVLKMKQPPLGTLPTYILPSGTIPIKQVKVIKPRALPVPDSVQTTIIS